jgi:hypothetical protein
MFKKEPTSTTISTTIVSIKNYISAAYGGHTKVDVNYIDTDKVKVDAATRMVVLTDEKATESRLKLVEKDLLAMLPSLIP